MSEPKFVHLRVHTAYSLSEGAMQVPALIHKCHAQGIAAIAVTDTANMFGGKAFSKYASEEGVKPIMGCQFYLRNPDADDMLKSKCCPFHSRNSSTLLLLIPNKALQSICVTADCLTSL